MISEKDGGNKFSEHPIRVSVVSYLNSKPFIYGLKNSGILNSIILSEDIPSVCAAKLLDGGADIGLVPVAALLHLKDYNIISDYCIGAVGRVSSVLLLSNVPLNKIDTVLLDYQSRTSVLLARILAGLFWKIKPVFKSTAAGYENEISGNNAAVVIGDRALLLRTKYKYVYDLSDEWQRFTGLPFVFACWTSTVTLPDEFILEFNNALRIGLTSIETIAASEASGQLSKEEIRNYLESCISFNFDEDKKTALKKFLELAKEIE